MLLYQAKREDRVYLTTDWNEGDRDVHIECHQQFIATNRKTHMCAGNGASQRHEVQKGERMLVQKAKVEGHWGSYRLCLVCCDKWLDQVTGSAIPRKSGSRSVHDQSRLCHR